MIERAVRWAAPVLACACAAPAFAQAPGVSTPSFGTQAAEAQPAPPRPVEPYVRLRETITTNANLGAGSAAKSDWITELGGGLRIKWDTRRLNAFGDFGASQFYYAGSSQKARAIPRIDLRGTWEAIDRLLFIDSSLVAQRTFSNSFGFQSPDRAIGGDDAITTTAFRVSPYIRGRIGDAQYTVRNDNIWVKGSGAVLAVRDSYQNVLSAQLASTPRPIGWEFSYSHTDTKYENQPSLTGDIARARILYQLGPELQVSASGGYESNEFITQTVRGPVYGGGMSWRPGPRTTFIGSYESRYFGPSHRLSFDHRTRLLAFSVNSTRDVFSLPQLASTIPIGVDLRSVLDGLFLGLIPDPIARAAYVDAYMAANNLPRTLTAVSYSYAPVLTLRSTQSVTVAAVGAQNVVTLTAYVARSEPVSSDTGGLIAIPNALLFNRQRGVNLTYTNRLTRLTRATTSLFVLNTQAVQLERETQQRTLQFALDHRYTGSTSLLAMARYQRFITSGASAVYELALIGGLEHRF